MKRLFALLFCIIKSKKIFSVNKKEFVIFDCENSKILSEILPKNKTYIISARVNLIKKILVNFTTIKFLIKNLFSRSIQLNYYISLILQLQPKIVITTIDNSLNFSILTKYFDGKIKFVAIQNGTRGGIYENENNQNQILYFQNYLGFSNFDLELMMKKEIYVKNFISVGSLKNSYFKNFIKKNDNNLKKNFDISFVSKNIFEKEKFVSSEAADISLELLKFLSTYAQKYNKKIAILSKSKTFNSFESQFIEKLFSRTNYKIFLLGDEKNFDSYENVSSSNIVVGAPSSLLREASIYYNTKILCFYPRNKPGKYPFVGLNILSESSYKKFEERLNLLFDLNYEDYLKKLEKKHDYLMKDINTVEYLLKFLRLKTN